MVVQNKALEHIPLKQIPEAWGARGHCPACGTAPLRVVHLPDPADYLICPKCELSFEVEANAGNIRVKNVPELLGFAEGELHFHWVKPARLRELLDNRKALIEKPVGTVAPGALSDEEVWNRMLSLYHLGNTPKMVELIVMQAGATREQAEAAFARLKKRSEQDTRNQVRKFWILGGIIAVLAIVLVGGWAFAMNRINAELQQGISHPAAQNPAASPLEMLNALPDALKPAFLKAGPVQVQQQPLLLNGTKLTKCPTTPSAAAALFGGDAQAWSIPKETDKAWQMVGTGAPATIKVPAGMVAGIIDPKTFNFSSVNGPATIYNVNFIAIMCD
jgi:hypothetical protein